MHRFLRLTTLIIIALVFSSCLRYHGGYSKMEVPKNKPFVFPEHFQKVLYKTNIKFWNKAFSGLMFFKQNDETKETRIVFMSEVGLKFFDFKLDKEGIFSVEYLLEELNRKSLISVLEKDLKLLLQKGNEKSKVHYFSQRIEGAYMERYKSGSKSLYYIFDSKTGRVNQIDYTGSTFKKIRIKLKNTAGRLPTSISIKHYGLRLQLQLRLIE